MGGSTDCVLSGDAGDKGGVLLESDGDIICIMRHQLRGTLLHGCVCTDPLLLAQLLEFIGLVHTDGAALPLAGTQALEWIAKHGAKLHLFTFVERPQRLQSNDRMTQLQAAE